MSLVVLLRGVNVGGYKTFRPSVLAKELKAYDVVNVGAAGTFVIRKPVSQAKLRGELARRLPFETDVMICDGREFIRIASADPFVGEPSRPELVRFVSVLANSPRVPPSMPVVFPASGEWLLRILAFEGRFLFGVYKRHMKAISYLSQIEKVFGVSVTTRNWNTIAAIVKILKA